MRTMLSLLVVTVIAVVIAVLVVREHDQVYVAEKQLLLPEFKDRVNDAARVAIKGYDGEVVLERVKDKWGIAGRGQYPANFQAIKTLLVALAQAELLEYKTNNPELYAKLGLAGTDVEGSESRELDVQDEAGDPLAFLIIGNRQRLGGAGQALPAYYARLPEEPRSMLVQGELNASIEVRDWLEEMILNISPDRIRDIQIWNTFENMRIFRDSEEETDFQLTGIPEGMQLKAQLTLNRMGTILEEFRIDDVLAAGEFEFSEEATAKTEIRTFDGLLVRSRAEQRDEKAHVVFEFSATEPVAADAGADDADGEGDGGEGAADAAKADGKEAQGEAGDAAVAAAPPEVSSEVLREIEELNRRLGPWVFVVPYFKYDMLARRIGPLVEDIASDADADADTDADADADTEAGDEAPPSTPPA